LPLSSILSKGFEMLIEIGRDKKSVSITGAVNPEVKNVGGATYRAIL
jgi:hypothetical protein